jgi:hypothetical protein
MRYRALVVLALALFIPLSALAQGSRKDDIVLNRFGQPLAGASVTVCTAGATGSPCSPLAAIYSDVALTQPLANPMSSDGQGNYHFYAAPGRYMVQISGAGATTTTIPDVLLPADPTAPSYQSLTVTQNITAASLNLTGNLSVSGQVSSPSAVSAPQSGMSAPVQVGPHWYPGTASGLVTPPSAAPTITNDSATAGNIGNGTYYCAINYGNVNGPTYYSPEKSITISNGTGTNTLAFQPADYNAYSGAYKMQAGCNTSSGGPYYVQMPWTVTAPIASNGCTRTSNVVTCQAGGTVSPQAFPSNFPVTVGMPVIVSGVGTGSGGTNFNGTFTVTAVGWNGTNYTFSYAQALANDTSTGTGAFGTFTGLQGAEGTAGWHYINNVEIISSINLSGPTLPTTNTATIDPIQVAFNAARCNGSNGDWNARCGTVKLTGTKYTLTTPLILGGQSALSLGEGPDITTGETDGGSNPRSTQFIPNATLGANPNVGTVMVMGPNADIHGFLIQCGTANSGLMFVNNGNGFHAKGGMIDCSGSTGSPIWFNSRVSAFNYQFDGVSLTAGANSSGGIVRTSNSEVNHVTFNHGRWNCGGTAPGVYTQGGPDDFDHQMNFVSVPSGIDITIHNVDFETCAAPYVRMGNGGITLDATTFSDPVTSPGTNGANIELFDDPFQQSGAGAGIIISGRSYLPGSLNADASIFMNIHGGGPPIIFRDNSGWGSGASGVIIDFNNFQGIYQNSGCPFDSATGIKNLLMAGNSLRARTSIGCGNSIAAICNELSGDLMLWQVNGSNSGFHDKIASNALTKYWRYGSETAVEKIDSSGNLSVAGTLGFGGLAGGNGATFSPPGGGFTGVRTFTWPDASGTPALVLAGTSASLGGSALTAGGCSSTTVSISGATTSMAAFASPSSDPGSGFYWLAFVSSANTATVRICAAVAGTPTATTYNVRVIQ